MEKHKFSSDCKITNFRINKATGNIHANLIDSDGSLIISATLDYITEQINNSEFIRSVSVPQSKPAHNDSQEP